MRPNVDPKTGYTDLAFCWLTSISQPKSHDISLNWASVISFKINLFIQCIQEWHRRWNRHNADSMKVAKPREVSEQYRATHTESAVNLTVRSRMVPLTSAASIIQPQNDVCV